MKELGGDTSMEQGGGDISIRNLAGIFPRGIRALIALGVLVFADTPDTLPTPSETPEMALMYSLGC
jgi:hypothetical protein